jgi:hypothetical protein
MDGIIIDPEDTEDGKYKKGGMLKRADGSYSKRGLWDNIRANKGSGKKPTKQMLAQERKINKKEEGGELDPPTAWEQAMQKLKHYSDPVNAARLLTLGPIGESALSLGKSQIAGNINPVGYGTSVARKPTSGENTLYQDATSRHKGPISKFTNALVEPALGSANWTNKEGGPKKNIQPWELERQDLLNMLVNDGLPGSSGISVSNYRPSNSNKDSVYYNSPATEQSILNNLRENPDLLKQFKERNGIKTHVGYGLNTTQRTSDQGNVLGNYTMTLQKDKDGREYIDYSDVWDLQPFKTSKGATKITDAFQTAAGMKVPKVYGRVYLDQLNKKEEGGPLDPPTKEDPPSTWDKLKQTAQHYSKPENFIRAALLGPVGEMGLNYVKGRVAENINPVGYESPDEASVTQGPVGKLIDAVRRPQAGSAAWNEKGSDAWLSERQDLLNMMLNDDLPSGKLSRDGKKGIGVSAYKPSYAVDGTTYYDSPATKASIIETLKRDKKFLDNFKAGKDGVRTYTGYGLDDTESAHEQGNVLGNYRMTMGKDDNGDYIDYYDKWDLQPWKRTNKTLTKITDAAQRMAGVVTPEIYGRVYMNELEGNQKKYGGSLEDLAMMAPSKKKKTLKDLAALAKKKRKNK